MDLGVGVCINLVGNRCLKAVDRGLIRVRPEIASKKARQRDCAVPRVFMTSHGAWRGALQRQVRHDRVNRPGG